MPGPEREGTKRKYGNSLKAVKSIENCNDNLCHLFAICRHAPDAYRMSNFSDAPAALMGPSKGLQRAFNPLYPMFPPLPQTRRKFHQGGVRGAGNAHGAHAPFSLASSRVHGLQRGRSTKETGDLRNFSISRFSPGQILTT